MAFRYIGNYLHATPPRIVTLTMTNSEAATAGRMYKMSSGRPTKLVGGDRPQYLGLVTKTAGTDVSAQFQEVRIGDIFLADATGTAASGFVVGATAVDVDANGDNIDRADVTNGYFTVDALGINSTDNLVYVRLTEWK